MGLLTFDPGRLCAVAVIGYRREGDARKGLSLKADDGRAEMGVMWEGPVNRGVWVKEPRA